MFIPKYGTDVTSMDEFAKDNENNNKTETETQQNKLQSLEKTLVTVSLTEYSWLKFI